MSKNPVYISRRNFLKVGAFTAAMATLSVPAFAASDEENCFRKITAQRDTQYGPVQGVDQGDSLVYGTASPMVQLRWEICAGRLRRIPPHGAM